MNFFNWYLLLLFMALLHTNRDEPAKNLDLILVEVQKAPTIQARAGAYDVTSVVFDIADGYHIMADHGEDQSLLYTRLNIEEIAHVSFGTPRFPEPVTFPIKGAGYSITVFDDSLHVDIPLQVAKEAPKKSLYTTRGTLTYQACDASRCFLPRKLDFPIEIHID
jgi:hypothetical protein